METLPIGDNEIVKINLKDETGADQNISGLYSITVFIIQQQRTLATYVYGTHTQVRQGDTAQQIALEVTQEVSKKLSAGTVYVQVLAYKTRAEFLLDSGRKKDTGKLIPVFEAVSSGG